MFKISEKNKKRIRTIKSVCVRAYFFSLPAAIIYFCHVNTQMDKKLDPIRMHYRQKTQLEYYKAKRDNLQDVELMYYEAKVCSLQNVVDSLSKDSLSRSYDRSK